MKQRKSILFAIIAILMWSTSGTAFVLSLKTLEFSQLLFIASNTAWITLLLFAIISKKKIRLKPIKNLIKSAIGGFLNPFLFYMILLKAYSMLPAQIAQPLNYTWPIMLVILSVPFLKQKLKWFDYAAISISFLGVLVISMQGENSFHQDRRTIVGIILATGSSIIWASFWIFNVRDKRDELEKILLNFFFGALFVSLWLLITKGFPAFSTGWYPAVYVGITEMAIAFVCWLIALQLSDNNSRIGNLVFLSPFLALFFIHLILKEQIFISTFAGLALIVGGIMFQQFMVKYGNKREQ